MQSKNRQNMNDKSKQEMSGYQSYLIQDNLKYFKPHKTSVTVTFAEELRKTLQEPKNQLAQNFSMMKMVPNYSMKYVLFRNTILTILKQKFYKHLRKNYSHTFQTNFI